MKKILVIPLLSLSLLSAMEGPTKKARVDVPASSETAQPLSTPLTEQESDTNKVKSLKELTAKKLIKNHFEDPEQNLLSGFPQGFFDLPIEMQEYIVTQPLPNRMGRTWWHEAKTKKDIDTLLTLSPHFYVNEADDFGNTPFNKFIQEGRTDLAKYLLTKLPGLNVIFANYKFQYPLNTAIRYRDAQLARKIIETIKNIPTQVFLTRQDRPFTEEQLAQIVQQKILMLLNHPDINVTSEYGQIKKTIKSTPFLLAVRYHLPEIVSLLANSGITIKSDYEPENNPLIQLMHNYSDKYFKETAEILIILLSEGIDINSKGKDSQTALLELVDSINDEDALKENTKKLIRILIEKGLDINAANKYGDTALHVAPFGKPQLIPLLIELGSDESLRDIENKTALDYLKEENPEFIPLYEESLKKRAEKQSKEAEQQRAPAQPQDPQDVYEFLEQFLLKENPDTGTSE